MNNSERSGRRAPLILKTGLSLSLGLAVCTASPGFLRAADPTPLPAAPLAAAADTTGYGGQVLAAVLPHWNPPAGLNGLAQVLVRVSSQGRVLSCEGRNPLGGRPGEPLNAEQIRLNDAACQAVAVPSGFPAPAYGMVSEVILTFAAGNYASSPEKAEGYAEGIIKRASPRVVVPVRLGGELSARVRLRISADGAVEEAKVEKSSGNKELDASILNALTLPGVVTPPPDGNSEVILTFTVRGD